VAVRRFLDGSLGFTGIAALAELAVDRFGAGNRPDLDDLIALDTEVGLVRIRATPGGAPVVIQFLISILVVLAILVVLVVIHEFGHFIVARRARVRVHEFRHRLFRARAHPRPDKETVYTLNWLPLGGFVRLEGGGRIDDPRAFVNAKLRTGC